MNNFSLLANLKLTITLTTAVILASSCSSSDHSDSETKPNIIVVYVDDLGYGDIGCYGANGVETPNVDLLATKGLRFTDAHCPASTCTPSRYSLLTGEFAFRINAAVLQGDAPLLIDTNSLTLPGMLQNAGYNTGIVGKWHLGLGDGNLDWNDSIKPGPLEVGFDYCFLIPATGDRVPTVYVENHRVIGLDPNDPLEVSFAEMIGDEPTGMSNPELLKQQADPQHSNTITNGISRIGFMSGGNSARWIDEEFPEVLTSKAKEYITRNKENPFFLFFSFHDIHVPRIPNPRFEGISKMGPRGDAIAQVDWCTGEIMKVLRELNLDKNTLIIFSSDNGPVLNDGYADQAVELLGDHLPSGPFRGGKYSAFEAGTRVPTIAYWPGTIDPGESAALLSQIDIFASLAKLTGQKLKPGEAPDSYNTLDAWLGKSSSGRTSILEESFVNGYREDNWKYIPASDRNAAWIENDKKIESGISLIPKLYNLAVDPGEQVNLAKEHPERIEQMDRRLKEVMD